MENHISYKFLKYLAILCGLFSLESCSILFRNNYDNVHRSRLLPADYFENSAHSFSMSEYENMVHIDHNGLKIPNSNLNVFEKYSRIERKDSVSYILVYNEGKIVRYNKLIYKLSIPIPISTLGLGSFYLWKSYKDRAWVDTQNPWFLNAALSCLIVDASTGTYSIVRDAIHGNKKRWRLHKIVPISKEDFEKL